MRAHRLAVVIAVGRWSLLALTGLAVFMTWHADANPYLMGVLYLALACLAAFWLECIVAGGAKDE